MKLKRITLVLLSTTFIGFFFLTIANGQRLGRRNEDTDRSVRNSRDLDKAYDRAEQAATVFKDALTLARRGNILQTIFNHTYALAIIPARLKYSSFAGHRGEGIVSLRDSQSGIWTPPVFINIGGPEIDNKFKTD